MKTISSTFTTQLLTLNKNEIITIRANSDYWDKKRNMYVLKTPKHNPFLTDTRSIKIRGL